MECLLLIILFASTDRPISLRLLAQRNYQRLFKNVQKPSIAGRALGDVESARR